MQAISSGARLAIDIGGTFTDGVLQHQGRLYTAKIPTTPSAPEAAFLEIAGMLLAEAAIDASTVAAVIHGTTLATNALIERKGAVTALITTEGFRDSLEIGYESRFDQYDLDLVKPEPLVPRRLRFTVSERMLASGEVHLGLDTASLDRVIHRLRGMEIEAIAVGLLHAHVNPAHEQLIGQRLAEELPDIPVSLSSAVCPEIREYERLSTTVADACVRPLMQRYLGLLDQRLQRAGFRCPVFLVTSSGGITGITDAAERPVHLVESGPSGGAALAALAAERCNQKRVLSFDMGGTTAKICLIDDFRARTSREFEAARNARFVRGSGLPLRIPVTEMIEIGAGGGSIVSRDDMARIRVGPDSAGAEPGPACYGRGGSMPTVSDADLLLGRIDAEVFGGGRLSLDPKAAAQAFRGLSTDDESGPDVETLAAATREIIDENMAGAARIHAAEHGADLRAYSMIAFGGAGPLHAAELASRLGIRRVIVPPHPGVGSALGFLAMPVHCELSRSRYMTLSCFDEEASREIIADLTARADAIVAGALPGVARRAVGSALMRYVGQGHEIEVPLPAENTSSGLAASLRQGYAAAYRARYGRTLPAGEIEVLTYTVRVSAVTPELASIGSSMEPTGALTTEPGQSTTVQDPVHDAMVRAQRYQRHDLHAGDSLAGPALVVEPQTTVVVPEGFHCRVDDLGNLVLEGETAAARRDGEGDDVRLQVMWNRLQSIVDEQATVLMKTAFSPIVRESGDLSVGIFNRAGEMLAQAVTGTPGHVNTMASACPGFFGTFPPGSMQADDIYLTNDPWAGAGHLNDFVLLRPCFHRGKLVGFVSCTSHLVDIGGRCMGPDGNDVYDEGLYIPHLRLVAGGEIDATLLALLQANSRDPLQSVGDIHALIACCEKGEHRLREMLEDLQCDDLEALSQRILLSSEEAVRRRIAGLPDGEYPYAMTVDGYEAPITLEALTRIQGDSLHLDFHRSAPPSRHGINVPINYTMAYTVFGLKCAVAPGVPNNHGSLKPFRVTAAPGSILDARKPAPVCSRHILGQLLPDVALGCLAGVMPDTVPAEGASTLWDIPIHGRFTQSGATFAQELVFNGGTGARPGRNGLSATAYPSGVMGSLVETTENSTPLLIRRRELRPGSGGEGTQRGGHGQVIELEALPGTELTIYGTVDRVKFPARGRRGGLDGATGRFTHSAGIPFHGKGSCRLLPGEVLTVETPGGGGHGPPPARREEERQTDAENDLENEEVLR
jgi:N-methylhydantoinase A/oxoprolinase/acetone carboxylase beta subunit/N-methylhydantoinase B/oxoprolinase/acetone carboxylase alpha subunit